MSVPPPPPKRNYSYTWEPFALPGIDVALRRRVYSGPVHPLVPTIDPHYAFREDMVRELAWALFPHDGGAPTSVLMSGPKGCGKTSLAVQLAAHCRCPVRRLNCNVGTTAKHLKGRIGAQGGSTVFVPGIATLAMEDGSWLLLDELSGATPPVALALFPVLEMDPPGDVSLPDAQPPRYVDRHPDFRVVMSDNVIGAAQEESRFNFSGTNPNVNAALLDRIGGFIEAGYLVPKDEFNMIKSRIPSIEPLILEGMIRVAGHVRASGEAAGGFSTRMLIEWARRYAAGRMDAKGAVTAHTYQEVLAIAGPAFLNKMRSGIERTAVIETIRRVFELKEDS